MILRNTFFCAGKRQTRLFFLSPDTTIFHYQIVSKSVILLTNQKKESVIKDLIFNNTPFFIIPVLISSQAPDA